MKNINFPKDILSELIAALLILLFVYTASSKLITRPTFAIILGQSPLIGSYKVFISWFIPIIEIVVAVMLLFPATRRTGFFTSLSLLTIFTLYIGYMVCFSNNLPCKCGGVIEKLSWEQHLIFNLFFILIAAAGIFLQRKAVEQKAFNNRFY